MASGARGEPPQITPRKTRSNTTAECLENLQKQMEAQKKAQKMAVEESQTQMAIQMQAQKEMQAQMNAMRDMMQQLLQMAPAPQVETPAAQLNRETPVPEPQLVKSVSKSFNISTLPKLSDEADYREFCQWKKQWEVNAKVHGLENFPRSIQVFSCGSAMGSKGMDIVEQACGINMDDEDVTVDGMLQAMQGYFREMRSLTVDRLQFHQRKQGPAESFDQFRFALNQMAEDAELCPHCRDTQIVTQIMAGTRDEKAQNELLRERPFPTLERTVTVCRSTEIAAKNQETMMAPEVNKVSEYKRQREHEKRGRSQSRNRYEHKPVWSQSRNREESMPCCRCGNTGHVEGGCPFKDKECFKCQKIGHTRAMCQSEESASVSSVLIGHVETGWQDCRPFCKLDTVSMQFSASGKVLGCQNVLPDSGAGANLMGVRAFRALGQDPGNLRKAGDVIYGANKLSINLLGRTVLNVKYGKAEATVIFLVSDEYDGVILSKETCKKLLIIPQDFPRQINAMTPIQSEGQLTELQREKLKAKILMEFKDVFDEDGPLKPMKGGPMKIQLRDGAVPHHVTHCRMLPIPIRSPTKEELDRKEGQGVIGKACSDSKWKHSMAAVVKPNGKIRICLDTRELNKWVVRPYYPSRTPKEVVSAIPASARWFSTFDAASGYFQIELDEASQDLTTFITPWGSYKCLRAPMGLSCTGDEYNRRGDEALEGIPNMQKLVDDVIIYGSDLNEHLENVRMFLERCREHGITLNESKFRLAQTSVPFAGYIVSRDGIKADPNKLKAIKNFPKPKNLTDIRSFVGLTEQLAGFSTHVAGAMQPLRPLLSPRNEFVWSEDHERAFEETKQALSSTPVLRQFDPKRPTRLETDASRTKGLGYVLLQQAEDRNWHLVEANSRFITEAESRYAMVELELIGAAWAMKKCRMYLLGLGHFTLVVDHQPLLSILNKQTLDYVDNARIQRIKASMAPYNFTAEWRKGKEHRIADALSRNPVNKPLPEDIQEDEEIFGYINAVLKTAAVAIEREIDDVDDDSLGDPILEKLRAQAKNDPMYQELVEAIKSGKVPRSLSCYEKILPRLSLNGGLVMFDARIVIPSVARKEVLKRLHASHQGINRTMKRARQSVYWPGISSDVRSTVEACRECQIYLPSQQREPIERDPLPKRCFEELAADFFEVNGHHFLVMVDRLSGFPIVEEFHGVVSTEKTAEALLRVFTTFGSPVRLHTDGGLQFTAQVMQDFLVRWGVRHRLSTPAYPQSNGLAESAVKTVKHLLLKVGGKMNEVYHEGLLELRNTPRPGGKSPAELCFGHPTRSRVPAAAQAYEQRSLKGLEEHLHMTEKGMERATEHFNRSARELKPIEVGRMVLVQDQASKLWKRTGKVVRVGKNRAYKIKFEFGRDMWRNRRFLRPLPEERKEARKEENRKRDAEAGQPGDRRSKRVRFKPLRYGET